MSEKASGTPSAARPPGRPRSADADEAILQATLDLLAELGYRGLSMEAVRQRSGVGKATIYRRWKDKEALVKDAIVHLNQDLPVPEDTGSLGGDFQALALLAVAAAKRTYAPAVLPRLVAEASVDPDMHAIFYANLIAPRRRVMTALLERARARGEVRADLDLDLCVDLVVGPLIYRQLIELDGLETIAQRPTQVLHAVLHGIAPR